MTAIERTAFPRFASQKKLRAEELHEFYTPNQEEIAEARKCVRGDQMRLNFVVLLKCFQRLGYFPHLNDIPGDIIAHIRRALRMSDRCKLCYSHSSSLYRHRGQIRAFLRVTRWGRFDNTNFGPRVNTALKCATKEAYEAAQTMNNPADIINVVIEQLVHHRFELPAYSTIDRLVKRVRGLVNNRIFKKVVNGLKSDPATFDKLSELLEHKEPGRTAYNNLKQLPKKPTITHFKELLAHHSWLISLGPMEGYFENVAKVKISQFAAEAKSLDVSDLREMNTEKRFTLIAALAYKAQHQAKDALALTFCKTMARLHKRANQELERLREEHQEKTNKLISVLHKILVDSREIMSDDTFAHRVKQNIEDDGGTESLLTSCDKVLAYNSKNHLPLVWQYYKNKRPAFFKLIQHLNIQSTTQNRALIDAIHVVLSSIHSKSEHLDMNLDLSFAPKKWQSLITSKSDGRTVLNRRHFEACAFSCLADELRSGDVFIEGAGSYADYRNELLSWPECQQRLNEFCDDIGIPNNPRDFVDTLKNDLLKKASLVDQKYPDLSELVIEDGGNPVLKRRKPSKVRPQAIQLARELRERLPERNLIDILCNTHHYAKWAHEFAPISGSNAKVQNSTERYIVNTFGQGSGMGPVQMSRHIRTNISAHMLSWINRRHVTPSILDKTVVRLINYINGFRLTQMWGDGSSCAADGTLCNIYEENLFAEHHLRYGKTGGIAYHHVANNYVALFSSFIPCGVWEAVEIIEALLKNQSDIKPKTVHADTQGQSTPVFGLSYLLGIKLMPRIRNWKDLTFFRPCRQTTYKHIDGLFTDFVDWDLIEEHWQDLMQVVLSIRAGKISSSLLLRKLSHYSRKNRLYKAFQELGRVVRTGFLLEFISDIELREVITAATNKVESYNALTQWCRFASRVIVASNDEDEMEKAIKYTDVIANSVILQNIIDMSEIICQLAALGMEFSKEDVTTLSPYMTEHIKRFGDYAVNLSKTPPDIGASKDLVPL